MTKEQEQAIKSMQNFVNSTMDTTVVTAKEMKIVLNLIQQLQQENKQKDKQIDLMTKEIFYKLTDDNFSYGYSEEEVKQYFQKKASEE